MSYSSSNTTPVENIEENDIPWVEKYRPISLTDICGQPNVITLFEKVRTENRPMHYLFYGPPGTGKTTTILCLIKEYQNKHKCKNN